MAFDPSASDPELGEVRDVVWSRVGVIWGDRGCMHAACKHMGVTPTLASCLTNPMHHPPIPQHARTGPQGSSRGPASRGHPPPRDAHRGARGSPRPHLVRPELGEQEHRAADARAHEGPRVADGGWGRRGGVRRGAQGGLRSAARHRRCQGAACSPACGNAGLLLGVAWRRLLLFVNVLSTPCLSNPMYATEGALHQSPLPCLSPPPFLQSRQPRSRWRP